MKIYLQQQILIMLRKIASFKYSKALYQKYVCIKGILFQRRYL